MRPLTIWSAYQKARDEIQLHELARKPNVGFRPLPPDELEELNHYLRRVRLVQRCERRLQGALAGLDRVDPPLRRGLPTFDLNPSEPVLIVECPTGIVYTAQVGGKSCLHPTVEGAVLTPFVDELHAGEWMSALGGISCPDACSFHITDDLADAIVAAWPEQRVFEWQFFLDRTRLDEGTEAWFPIVFRQRGSVRTPWARTLGQGLLETMDIAQHDLARWLDGRRGWLLMPDNCD
jgi:hypothetical protein